MTGRLGLELFDRAVPLALATRGGMVEIVHAGHLLVTSAAGTAETELGDADLVIWPRSTLKPLQAVAMVRLGLELPAPLLALATASHDAEPAHIDGVRRILAGARSDATALAVPLEHTCSGKHAAMVATCTLVGWDPAGYCEPDHPLQQAIRGVVAEFTGVAVPRSSVDGCGAPLHATTLRGLARGMARVATAERGSPEARVADAMRAAPELVAGVGRVVTIAMRAVPGLVAKDGADGVVVAALDDGAAIAFKVADGSAAPSGPILVDALRGLGVLDRPGVDRAALRRLGERPVLGGGRRVGVLSPVPRG